MEKNAEKSETNWTKKRKEQGIEWEKQDQGTTYQEKVMTVIGSAHLRKLFSLGQILSALFVIDVSIESKLLYFQKQSTKNC